MLEKSKLRESVQIGGFRMMTFGNVGASGRVIGAFQATGGMVLAGHLIFANSTVYRHLIFLMGMVGMGGVGWRFGGGGMSIVWRRQSRNFALAGWRAEAFG